MLNQHILLKRKRNLGGKILLRCCKDTVVLREISKLNKVDEGLQKCILLGCGSVVLGN